MVVNTITEAKRRLSELIEKAQEGEEVIINKAGKPVALLTAYKKHKVPRKPGALSCARGNVRLKNGAILGSG